MNLKRKLLKIAGVLFIVAFAGLLWLDWSFGGSFVVPHNFQIQTAPADLPVENVQFPSGSGATIRGWFVAGQPEKGVVILMHGVNASRLAMLDRARFLHRAGYSVLLFDFQAHGESIGKHITFGWLESRDAVAAVNFIRRKFPGKKIGVIGVSMGAAAAIMAKPPLKVNAMILESVYPTIEQAVEDRMEMRFGNFAGKIITPLLTWQMKPRLGFSPDDLCPIKQVGKITVPKFFIAGTADRETTLPESKALFNAAAEPKQLWLVDGAGHVDMDKFAKAEYQKRVLDFLAKYLG